MKRTAEKVLSIIGMVLTGLSIVLTLLVVFLFHLIQTNETVRMDFEASMLEDPAMTLQDLEMVYTIFGFMQGFSWFMIIMFIISIVLTIFGLVNLRGEKNPKAAGIFFLIAGFLAGILSLPSILLYIAGILCFTRKPPVEQEQTFVEQNYDDGMRPL